MPDIATAAAAGRERLLRPSRAAATVTTMVFGILSVPLLLLPWLVGRVARVDPLWSPPGWTARRPARGRAGHPWRPGTSVLPGLLRWRRGLIGLAAGVVVVGALVTVWLREEPPGVPAAFEGEEWYPEYFEDINWVMHSPLYQPLSEVRIPTATTRHLNVVEGRRMTWSPPACGSCPKLRVWVYGGSTTLGAGQRDGHTIPSELARVAWDAGYALDVDNRGVGGDTHWEEARRLAWDLAAGDRPDLVVFYDGINEVLAAQFELDPIEPPGMVRPGFWNDYVGRFPLPDVRPPPEAAIRPPEALPRGSAAEWAEAIVDRYARAQRTSRSVTAERGIPVRFFWQPSIEHRDPVEREFRPEGLEWAGLRSDEMLVRLPEDVVDLTQVFDGVDRPLFFDGVHTNEEGARLVAVAIFEALRPDLERLSAAAR